MTKDTFPGLLDASVGGHVELGSNYEEAAIKETKEETGIVIDKNKLVEITKTRNKSYDKVTGMTNNTFRMVYVYEYSGSLNDLKIEKEKATSLEFWPLDKIFNLSEEEKKQFIPTILKKEFIFKKIKEMISNKKKKVLIIHGWESNSKEHWFQEEKQRLEKMGYEVTVPDMPNTFYPKQSEWASVVEKFEPDENSILIGHSLGGTTILRYLEQAEEMVGKCILIATPINNCGYKEVADFFQTDFNWQKIKKMANKFVVIAQRNDIYVPLIQGQELAKNLGVDLIVVEGSDHFDKFEESHFLLLENQIK